MSLVPQKNSGLRVVFGLIGVACILSVALFFVYIRSEKEIRKGFADMQEMGKTLTIDGCVSKNIEWFQSCNAMTQLCVQSVSPMMKICLVNGDKSTQCKQYGKEFYGYNFGSVECKPYYSNKSLKKACADSYQAIADYCKAVESNVSTQK